jgi:hypothetical protein
VLALQLIIAGLMGGAQAAQQADAGGLGRHVLCLTGSPDRSDSTPANPHHHDLCCTPACAGGALLAPSAFAAVAYAAIAVTVVRSTADFGARPATTPPGLGRGPRAPPSNLV